MNAPYSTLAERSAPSPPVGNLFSPIGKQSGFTYISLLAAIVIIGISLGAAGKSWQNIIQRDKEEELLFRGDQYRRAIERYYYALPARPQYPERIDDLLVDNRTASGRRHLRRKYNDPVTNDDFVEVRDPLSKRIIGVYSASEKSPLRQGNFPEHYADFSGKEKYSEWKFIFQLRQHQRPGPGQQPPVPSLHRGASTPPRPN